MALTSRFLGYGVFFFLAVSGNSAHAYNYHLDKDINALISEGSHLTQKYQSARQGMKVMRQQKLALDQTKQNIDSEQSAYDKAAAEHQKNIDDHNNGIKHLKKQCNDDDIEANSSGHVNWCDNKIKTLNSETTAIKSEEKGLAVQNQAMNSKADDINKKILAWNHDQMLAISVFNNYSTRLNDWLNKAYTFMNTSDFQNNIAWAQASKQCADHGSNANADPEQELFDQARHALGCLHYVETARVKYYKKSS